MLSVLLAWSVLAAGSAWAGGAQPLLFEAPRALPPVGSVDSRAAPHEPRAGSQSLLFEAPGGLPPVGSAHSTAAPVPPTADSQPAVTTTSEIPWLNARQSESLPPPATDSPPLEGDTLAWWNAGVLQPMRADACPVPVDTSALMVLTVNFSQKVDAVREVTLVRQARVEEECAAFNPSLFADSIFNSTSDPVGNTLTTGGPSRLREDDWGTNAGLRRSTDTGVTWQLSQQTGLKDSNSLFFNPANQARSRMVMGVTKPLLRGRGRVYNTSLIVTASFQSDEARAEYFATLQEQLAQVAEAYWSLYVHRAALLQRQHHLGQAVSVSEQLRDRRGLDSLENQVMRADAAIATRRAQLIHVEADIRNIESRLRALTNAPALCDGIGAELVPTEPPVWQDLSVSLYAEVKTALEHRPEIDALRNSISAAAVRVQAAENELLPSLDLVLNAYVAGLEGGYQLGQSWLDQFNGPPGYTAGVRFAMPLGNQAAKARFRQRLHEQRRLERLLNETLGTIQAEVEVAVRSLEAASQAAVARRKSLEAVKAELAFLEDRWRLLRGDETVGGLQLEDLLNAQDRHLQEELLYTQALADFQLALVELQRATGTLAQPVNCGRQLRYCPQPDFHVSQIKRGKSCQCEPDSRS